MEHSKYVDFLNLKVKGEYRRAVDLVWSDYLSDDAQATLALAFMGEKAGFSEREVRDMVARVEKAGPFTDFDVNYLLHNIYDNYLGTCEPADMPKKSLHYLVTACSAKDAPEAALRTLARKFEFGTSAIEPDLERARYWSDLADKTAAR
jgi:TPR repeat protein